MKLVSPLLFLFLSITAQSQDLSNFEKLLVPVLNRNQITGANGSTFSTSLGLFAYGRTINYYPAGPSSAPPVIGQNLVNGRILELPIWEAPVVAKGRFELHPTAQGETDRSYGDRIRTCPRPPRAS
jgi:hypothetical protein